jgi:putative flippase GtrA
MILGLSTATYTLLHVLISLIGIGSGLVVLYGLLVAKPLNGITAIFLITTALTSITGFGFPFDHLLPSHIVGIISLVLLAFAMAGKYAFHLRGTWRWIYVVTGMMALYLNVFVLIVQLFEKVPALKALAPKQNEPPFAVSQLTVLALFIVLTFLAVKKFRVGPAQAA